MQPDTQPELSTGEADELVAAKTAPRVTRESIEARIASVDYSVHFPLTLCIIEMRNGFKVVGHSAPASPANFDAEVGKRYAYDAAFRQLWPLEGYALRERLAEPTPVIITVGNFSPEEREQFVAEWQKAAAQPSTGILQAAEAEPFIVDEWEMDPNRRGHLRPIMPPGAVELMQGFWKLQDGRVVRPVHPQA